MSTENQGSDEKSKAKTTQNEMIGNYILGAELGRGAFGAVYRGLDSKTGKMVAIKRMKLEKGRQPAAIQREIEFLSQFEHENIIKYHETIIHKNKLNIILEYMENGSLSDIIEQFGIFPEPLVAMYIYQVLVGLHFLHSKGVMHKDIKAANILVAKDGTIKLADFGIAYQISEDPAPLREIKGSPFWMSPEVIKNEGKPTTKSDIWSLSCTIIELISGSPPWADESNVSVVWKIVEGDMASQFPPAISDDLHDFLSKCFERNVDERPSAEDLLHHPWISSHVKDFVKTSITEVRKTVQLHTRRSLITTNTAQLQKLLHQQAVKGRVIGELI